MIVLEERETAHCFNVSVPYMSQALWHCLRNPPDNVAHVAFRVLSKFGGSNRKMLKEAQKVCLIHVTFF